MSARVRVATDHEGGLVAIKAARTLEERLALRYEADLLRRCGHPGVVALVGPADLDGPLAEHELAVRYVGDPVDRWRGDLRQTAGLVAAIAATLGDLHDMGVVHGRLDGSHVLVGADGRPRLCGFAPPGECTSADDVLQLGHLAVDLAERMVPVEQRWPLWRRGDVADRRALLDVLRRATADDPERRPSARAFATALLGAVPGAELPTGPADVTAPLPHPRRDDGPASAVGPVPATHDHGSEASSPQPNLWGHDEPASPTGPVGGLRHDPAVAGDQIWPATAPAPTAPQHPGDDPGEGLAPGPVDRPGRRWPAALPGFEREPDGGAGPHEVAPEPIVEPSQWRRMGDEILDRRSVPAASRLVRPEDRRAVARPAEYRLPSGPGTRCVDPLFGDQSSTELGEVFVDRPWPTARSAGHRDDRVSRHPSPSRRRRPRRRKPARSMPAALVVAGLAAVVAGTVIYYTGWAAPPSGPDPSASAECEAPPPTAPVVADVDGDGCTEEVRITDGIVQVDGQRWAVGGADDSVAVADWNCDGRATPAVYQSATGHVFVFPRWADDEGPLEVAATGSVAGGAGIVADAGDPCPSLAIEMPDGEHRPVEVAG